MYVGMWHCQFQWYRVSNHPWEFYPVDLVISNSVWIGCTASADLLHSLLHPSIPLAFSIFDLSHEVCKGSFWLHLTTIFFEEDQLDVRHVPTQKQFFCLQIYLWKLFRCPKSALEKVHPTRRCILFVCNPCDPWTGNLHLVLSSWRDRSTYS